MSRVQLALRVGDLAGSVDFYRALFGVEPAKRHPGYANFAIPEPPLKLILLEGEAGQPTVLDHLGVEVESTEQVAAAAQQLAEAGLATLTQQNTTCCHATQDKVWVRAPGQEPWEVYTVTADSETFGSDSLATAASCCRADASAGGFAQPTVCSG